MKRCANCGWPFHQGDRIMWAFVMMNARKTGPPGEIIFGSSRQSVVCWQVVACERRRTIVEPLLKGRPALAVLAQ